MLLVEYLDKYPNFEYLELWDNWYSEVDYIIKFERNLHNYVRAIIDSKISSINITDISFHQLCPDNGYMYFILRVKVLDEIILDISPYYGGSESNSRGKLSIHHYKSDEWIFIDTIKELGVYLNGLRI